MFLLDFNQIKLRGNAYFLSREKTEFQKTSQQCLKLCLGLHSKISEGTQAFHITFFHNYLFLMEFKERQSWYSVSWAIKEQYLSIKMLFWVWFKKKKAPMCCPLCVSHRHECVCVFVRECSDKKSFLLTYFPTMLSSCWSGPHRGLLVSRWCHRPDLPLLYKGFRYHCLCSHNTHSSRLLCSCKPKEQCYFLFQHYKAGLCRKLNRQNLYQTMLRVGWQYNPPPLAFQCVSLSFSLSLFFFYLFSIFLAHLLSFLLAREKRTFTGVKTRQSFSALINNVF